jgi:hypothetical protein
MPQGQDENKIKEGSRQRMFEKKATKRILTIQRRKYRGVGKIAQ